MDGGSLAKVSEYGRGVFLPDLWGFWVALHGGVDWDNIARWNWEGVVYGWSTIR